MHREMREAINDAEEDDPIGAIVITGAGKILLRRAGVFAEKRAQRFYGTLAGLVPSGLHTNLYLMIC